MKMMVLHYKSHFRVAEIERDSILLKGTTIRFPNSHQIYEVKHIHIDHECVCGEDYITIYVKEYKPKFWHYWTK